jgi:hypothetical protein
MCGSCYIACMYIACMSFRVASLFVSYEAEDACHMRKHLTGCHVVSYEAEDACPMRRRMHVI